ncbi:MAG: helix-turn-helix transcriptional regulator [Gluconacetobacter diazotrophicus]|nr:helix-turn-helix transcriptional regulator [Gluconacetobacter diazotrophicus]
MHKPSSLTDAFSVADPAAADSVGARIRLLRQRRGMTQGQLAGELGVSRSAIALWETDRGGETNHLTEIAATLGVKVDFFLTGMATQAVTAMLSVDENVLLTLYRACGAAERLALLRSAGRLRARSARSPN